MRLKLRKWLEVWVTDDATRPIWNGPRCHFPELSTPVERATSEGQKAGLACINC